MLFVQDALKLNLQKLAEKVETMKAGYWIIYNSVGT